MLTRPRNSPDVRRDELLFVFILTAWLCAVLYFDPRLLALMDAADSLFAKACVPVFVLCLNGFWFYAIYDVTLTVASALARRKGEPDLPPTALCPPVAVLYTTKNDFRAASAASCLGLDYPAARLFILDDSTDDGIRREVDAWAAAHPERVTVLRRQDTRGYKAGNMNRALEKIGGRYPYFAVCDADGVLPPGFVTKLLPFFEAYPDAAFVQAAQAGDPDQPDWFGRRMHTRVFEHYRHFTRAKDRFGFVMFYGHGALLKTEVWRRAGGFPEIVTEDLAFAARAREIGYRGYYTESVVCREDFPPSYARLRVRSEKWIRGTSEFLKTGFARFAASPRVPWYEKVDVLAGAVSHYQSAAMLAFLFLLGALLPAYYDHFRYPGSFFLLPVPDGKTPLEMLVQVRYHIFWSPDFYLMMALTILGPLLPAVLDLWRKPVSLLRYAALSQFVFFGSLVAETAALIVFLATGRAVFRNTHDASSGSAPPAAGFHPNSGAVIGLELAAAAVFGWLCLSTRNLWFLAPASALALGPVVLKGGTAGQGRWIRAGLGIPLATGALIFGLVTLDLALAWTRGL